MDVELREALTHGFGPEPAHRPVSDRVEAGHRAVRRRRLAGTLVAVAAAGVVGMGAVVVLGADSERPGGQVATDPDTPESAPPASAAPQGWDDGEFVRYTAEGHTEVRPDVKVLGWLDAPYPPRSGIDRSAAVSLEFEGEEHWVLVTWTKDEEGKLTTGSSSWGPGGAAATFEDWVDEQVRINTTPKPEDNSAGYVRFADDGSLVSSHGVEILDQRHPVDLENFADADEASAAALLQGPDGKKWFVLVRYADDPDVIAVPFETVGTDLEGFLNYATQRYASGEGLR